MKGLAYEEELNKLGAHLLQFTTMLACRFIKKNFQVSRHQLMTELLRSLFYQNCESMEFSVTECRAGRIIEHI